MFFESVLDEYNTTLFTGLWLIIMIKRVLHKERLIYVIENGMKIFVDAIVFSIQQN